MDKRPDRYRNAVAPHIYIDRAADAVAFYERAFGAQELFRVAGKDGKIMYGELVSGTMLLRQRPAYAGVSGAR